MTISYKEFQRPTIEEAGHYYAGPEGRYVTTGDDIRVVMDLGNGCSEVDVVHGRRGVILSNEYIERRPSPLD